MLRGLPPQVVKRNTVHLRGPSSGMWASAAIPTSAAGDHGLGLRFYDVPVRATSRRTRQNVPGFGGTQRNKSSKLFLERINVVVRTVRATCLSDMPPLLKPAGTVRPSSETVLIPEEIAKRRVDPEIQEKVALAAAELCVRHRPAALPLSRHGADARLRSEGRLLQRTVSGVVRPQPCLSPARRQTVEARRSDPWDDARRSGRARRAGKLADRPRSSCRFR